MLTRIDGPSQTVQNVQLGDLFGFLTEYHGGCAPPAIQLGSYDIKTLPSMEIKFGSSNRPGAKILFTRDTCGDLLEYIISKGKSELEFGR